MAIEPNALLARFGGSTVNDLNNVLNTNKIQDPDDDISTLYLTHFFN